MLPSSISSISSLPTILHLGENFSNLSQSPTNSSPSPGEIDTRSRRNRYTISTKSTRDLGLSALDEINTRSWLETFNSAIQLECTIHAFPSLHLRRNTIRADQRTCLSLSNFMTLRRTHHEPILTLQLTGSLSLLVFS